MKPRACLLAPEFVRNLYRMMNHFSYKKWNRSLQSAYDPIECHFNEKDNKLILTNKNDQIRITNLLTYTIGGIVNDENMPEANGEKIPGAFDALFFYTFTNTEDEKNIYSSNLDENLWRNANKFEECKDPIYYKNYITNTLEAIPLIE